MDIKRPISHEAGHAVSALHFGFRVEGIEVCQGKPRALVRLSCNTHESMVVLASGIAAEQLVLGNYDPVACGSDQAEISRCGGGAIQSFLPEAIAVIRLRGTCFKKMRGLLTRRWIERQAECEAASNFQADCDVLTFELLSDQEVNGLCLESGQGTRVK